MATESRDQDSPKTKHSDQMRALYDYWREFFFVLAAGPHRIELYDGRSTEVHRLMAAVFGLLRTMRADGNLVYARGADDIPLVELAKVMHVSKPTAVVYLEWMRLGGELEETPVRSDKGYPMASSRRLTVPSLSKGARPGLYPGLSNASGGPKSSERGSQVKPSISTYSDTQERGRLLAREQGDINHVSTPVEDGTEVPNLLPLDGRLRRDRDASSQRGDVGVLQG